MENNNCCKIEKKEGRGFLSGIIYGIIPHSFCIAFILFSVVGAASAAALFKRIMIIPYFFETLIALSFVMATISAVFYLKRNNCLCKSGVKSKWKYLTLLYGITITTNIFMFYLVIPAMVNAGQQNNIINNQFPEATLKVQIPCTGHAPIIEGELKKDLGIKNVSFKSPNMFIVSYDPLETSPEKILSLEICKEYKATIN